MRFDWQNNQILELLRPLRRSVGDFERSWDHCAALQGTWRRIVTAVVVTLQQCISSLLQSQDCLYHNMACIIQIFLYIYIRSIWPPMVVEHDWRSTWTCPFRGPRDAPLGGRCGETKELEGRVPTINTLPHSRDIQTRIHAKVRLGLQEHRNQVRRHDTSRLWESTELRGWTKSWTERVTPKLWKIEFVFSLYDNMRWKWDDVYLLQGLPNIYSPSPCPPPLPLYHCTPTVASWRCTWRPGSSDFGDAHQQKVKLVS